MKTYKLLCKETEGANKTAFARIATASKKECRLEIDKNYYIDRYVNKKLKMLFYVHIQDGSLVKVCVYAEKGAE